jgi:hypothetical protein
MFILNKTYLEIAQNNSCLKFALSEQNLLFLIAGIIASQYVFLSKPEVMQPFLVSSDTNFFYHPSTYFNSLEASCFLAKWLLLHKKQLLAD